MDPNRHHEFIGGNEDRQSAMYFNRGIEENRSNTQYYSQERLIVNNKSCMCPNMSNNLACNTCHSAADGNWNHERTSRVDYHNTNISREKVNPMFVHESRQYFPPNPSYATEIQPTNRHTNGSLQQGKSSTSNKKCVLESNYNYKPHQHQQPHLSAQPNLIQMQTQSHITNVTNLPPQQLQQQQRQHINTIGDYSKEIIYDEKYQSRQDIYKDVKLNYTAVSDCGVANTTMYSDVMQSQKPTSSPVEIIRTNKVDPSNIINPSNPLSFKEQQASPNYARKCPQIFSHNDIGNSHATHQSLYMSTPQFSSDKFTNNRAQSKMLHESEFSPDKFTNIRAQSKILNESEFRVGSCSTDITKINERPMSTMTGYPSNSSFSSISSNSSNKYHQQMQDIAMQQNDIAPQNQESLINNVNTRISRCQNYYLPGAKTQIATVTETPPNIPKQPQITSQYLSNPKVFPSHAQIQSDVPHIYHQPEKSTAHDTVDFTKNENIYIESVQQHPNSGLYTNPYKTSSPMDTCCKIVPPTPYNSINSTFSENIGQQSYYKYGKVGKETTSNNSICPPNQNTPPPTPVYRTAGYKAQPYIYETQHIKYDSNINNKNFNMSPNIGTAASPSPSQATPPVPHIQGHHTNIAPQIQTRPSPRTYLDSAGIHSTATFCTYDRQPQNSKLLNTQAVNIQPSLQSQPVEPQIPVKTFSNLPAQAQKQSSIKKSQASKTNYRELINQVVAMRSATSEKELDLQIIKKALNSATGPTVTEQNLPPQSVNVPNNSSLPLPMKLLASNSENGFLVDNTGAHTHRNSSTNCVNTTLPAVQQTIKVEEPLSSSPLDLSMRTVKTKADSTEYRYNQSLLKKSHIDYKHALPRVDFTPNFSLHSDDMSTTVPKIVINQKNVYYSSEVSHSILVPVDSRRIPVQSQSTQQIKQYSTDEHTARVCTVTQHSELAPIPDPSLNSVVLKKSNENLRTCQMRPTVVETNPFATVRSIKPEPSMAIPKTIENLQRDTNLINLQKTIHSSNSEPLPSCTPTYCGSVIKTADQTPILHIEPPVTSNIVGIVNLSEQRNPNYLGRKRHLQEYSSSERNEPIIKQHRYQQRDALPKPEVMHTTTISTSVIALNEQTLDENKERDMKTVEKSIQSEINPPCCQRESSIIVNNNVPICKIEPLTPTMDVPSLTISQPAQIVPIKTETNSVIAARIRTKAELKGFTFNTPIDIGNTIKDTIKIKEEPSSCQIFTSELPSIPGLDEKYDSNSLLDFSWNNKCNEFMEQLLTRSQTKKNCNRKFININKEISVKLQDFTKAPIESNNTSNVESDENSKSWDKVERIIDSTVTGDGMTNKSPGGQSSQSATMIIQKKISKHDREKIRLNQEKRIAARLQVESSSESDDEIHKRKSDRSKKPQKKIKARQNTHPTDTNQYSDCGSDSSDTNDIRSCPTKVSIQTNEEDIHLNTTTKTPATITMQKGKGFQEKVTMATECTDNDRQNEKNGKDNLVWNILKSSQNEDTPESSSSKKIRSKGSQSSNEEKQTKQDKIKTEQENSKRKEEEIGKSAKKPKVHLKVDLNTMTRSKRKREIELQLANSKVLRNDKIIRNSTTKIKSIKRKYERKYTNQSSVSGVCKELSNKQSDRELSMHLRSRNAKALKGKKLEKVPGSNNKKVNKTAPAGVSKTDSQDAKLKSKEKHTDIFLEVYRYKRSLKIPPSLITIDHPHNLKVASSLPDLEHEHNSSLTNVNRSAKFAKSIERILQKSTSNVTEKIPTTSKSQQEQQPCDERRSIIDVLHSRVINTNVQYTGQKIKNRKCANSGYGISRQVHSDVSHSAESSLVTEMLSIPVKKEYEEESNDGKKRHFSIFETTVLKTKTRTESKMQQRKEIIREIFVGDDRPASAPPEIISQMTDGNDKMTFEQKYEQFLEQLNIVINDDKLRKYEKTSTLSSYSVSGSVSASASTSTANHYVKDEEDTLASNDLPDVEDKALDTSNNTNKIAANVLDNATSNYRRRRPGKYLRRKGSSGFDYIRKKKKPNPSISVSGNSMQNMILLAKLDRKTEDENYEKKIKTESDVCREIQKWVLNKSVGQSAIHKAARLGYIDVVVYCLDRMGMNPDQKDNAGYTPLHEACTKGWLEIARILLQYGANHSEAAHSGIRPLHEASENDHEEIVRLLLSYGADPLLATYSGQTPLMLASSTSMRDLLNNHLSDVQNVGPDRKPWHFKGPWKILDSSICGYDIFGGAPNFTCDMSRALRKSSVSNSIPNKKQFSTNVEAGTNCKTMMENCAVVLDNIDRFNSVRLYNDSKPEILVENSDSDGEMFEFEEADILLPPLYLLKDEGKDKWVLLSDLCNLLKVKSKDTLLNKIYPPSSSASSAHKSLIRELKMSDFLERATCLQLLCAGEKINICASKVVLIKYNDSVRNLLGVKTILMKF